MTVLVTGATGFLGSHVTELLLARGERTRLLVRPGDYQHWPAHSSAEVHVADIADRAALQPALDGVDRVLHCAARTGPWGSTSAYHRTNVVGLETLVRAAMTAGVRRLVHVSSITVHGNDVRGEADEGSPFRDEPNPYSRSKVAGERLLERLITDEGAPVTIVRPGWIYGSRDHASFARIVSMVADSRMIVIGSGNNHLPLIYADDAARGVLLASTSPHAVGRSYLLVNDQPVTQRDFVNAIAAELGVRGPSKRVPYQMALKVGAAAEYLGRMTRRRQPPPVMRYGIALLGGENRFSIDRARRELSFSPAVDLAEGVRRGIEWYGAACGTLANDKVMVRT